MCGDLGRRVREGEEAGRKVREERTQLAGQLQEVREQLRSEAQTREEAEARAKQEVCVDRRRRRGEVSTCSLSHSSLPAGNGDPAL